jgi:hypothetical protein
MTMRNVFCCTYQFPVITVLIPSCISFSIHERMALGRATVERGLEEQGILHGFKRFSPE